MLKVCRVTVAVLIVAAVSTPPAFGAETQPGALDVLVMTGGHKFDKTAFRSLFSSSDAIDAHFATDSDKPHPFEMIEAWSYDAIVLYNFKQQLTEKQRRNFMRVLDQGTGLVVLHHAISAYERWRAFADLVGGDFVRSSPYRGRPHKKTTFEHNQNITVTVAAPDHPITRGVTMPFTIQDETYQHQWIADDVHVLLKTAHPRSDEALGWTRIHNGRRVVYLQPGHGPGVFKHKAYRRLVEQAVRWAAPEKATGK